MEFKVTKEPFHYSTNHAVRETFALVLAGGSGSRLKHLTQWHAKPAVPFGGKYRTIDFSLSNCINSNIRRIGILTQYKSHSLNTHIQMGWSFLRAELGEFVSLMPAQQRTENSWYKDTADAVYQNLDILQSYRPRYTLILAGDHIYKMDYASMLREHVRNNAEVTVGCVEVPVKQASAFGVMSVDKTNHITRFCEKPAQPDTLPGKLHTSLASMGIYIFNTDYLIQRLKEDAANLHSAHDFGMNIIPGAVAAGDGIFAYAYRDEPHTGAAYWRDVGTVDAYFKANQELLDVTPKLNLYDRSWPIWTYQEQLPPAKFVFNDDERRGMAVDSMVSGGCIISGSHINHSLLSSNVHINSYCKIENAVILPDVEIGRNSKLRNVIIDKGCQIPPGTEIGFDINADRQRYYVSDEGICLVSPNMLGQELHNIA